ncbi:MAG: hypothetical protein QG604_854 [Candidatus Dependentiae bacterium]|nr:hypothetical protein [Candidatus Dependentiae bacterium]
MQKNWFLLRLMLGVGSLVLLSTPASFPASVLPLSSATIVDTVPDQFVWANAYKAPTAGSVILQTQIINGPTLSSDPFIVIGLSENNATTPAYTVNISYESSSLTYKIFATKRTGLSGPQGTAIITQASAQAIWNYLETWRTTSTGQSFTLQYQNGSLLLSGTNISLWGWQDTATPIPNITQVVLSSSRTVQRFMGPSVTSSFMTQPANTSTYLPLPTTDAALICFQANSLPTSLTCSLAQRVTDQPQYTVLFDTTDGIHTTLTHRITTPTVGSDIPNSGGSYDATTQLVPAATQTYYLLYSPQTGNNTVMFGLVNSAQQLQPLLSWSNPKKMSDVMALCIVQSNVALSNFTVQNITLPQFTFQGAIQSLPNWTGTLGLQQQGSTYTASGLAKNAAYAPGATTWNYPLAFPADDTAALQFNLQLTQPTKVLENGAIILFGTHAQDLPAYGIALEPTASDGTTTTYNSGAPGARIRAYSLTDSGIQDIGTPIVLTGTTLQDTYRIVYQKINGTDASISIYQIGSTKNKLGSITISGARTGIHYAALSCSRELVTYSNVAISAPSSDEAMQSPVGFGTLAGTAGSGTSGATSAGNTTTGGSNPAPATTDQTPANSGGSTTGGTSSSSGSTGGGASSGGSSSGSTGSGSTSPTAAPAIAGGFDTSVLNSVIHVGPLDPSDPNRIRRLPPQDLDFDWNTSALTKTIDLTNGFTLETKMKFDDNASSNCLAIGFSPSTVNTTQMCRFRAQGSTTAGFAGAAQLLLVTLNSSGVSFIQFMPSPAGTTSQIVNQASSTQSGTGSSHTLWVACARKDLTLTITVGIDTPLNNAPIYSWRTTATDANSILSKIALSSWATNVTCSDIQLKPYVAPSQADTAPQAAADPNSEINNINKSPLQYTWNLGNTPLNPNGILDPAGGGYITGLVTVTALSPTDPAAFMIGFTSNTSNTQSMQDRGHAMFPGAEYNIQVQITAATGYVSIRRPSASGDSPFDNPLAFTELLPLTQLKAGTTSYPTYKLWARYTPSGTTRIFDMGITSPTDTTDINALTPLWTWTESDVAASRAALQYASISSCKTGCTITKVAVTPNKPGAIKSGTTSGGTTNNGTPATFDGTISTTNMPKSDQWNLYAYQIKPGTEHKITASGSATSRIVLAFNQNVPGSSTTPPAFTALITASGITVYDATGKSQSTSADPLLGALQTTTTGYWVRADNTSFSLGGYAADGVTETSPYVSWTDSSFSTATSWYFTYGATSDATVSYMGGIITPGTTATAPSPVRRSTQRQAVTSRISGEQSTPSVSRSFSSNRIDGQQYRLNNRSLASAG